MFGPVFRYVDVFDVIDDFGLCNNVPRVQRWRAALAARPPVAAAAHADYPVLLKSFLERRGGALSKRIARSNAPAESGYAAASNNVRFDNLWVSLMGRQRQLEPMTS